MKEDMEEQGQDIEQENPVEADLLTEETPEVEGEAEESQGEIEAPAEEEAEEELPEGTAWYVIHCYSGYENKVKRNLESRIESMAMQDYIFQVVVPSEEEIELRDGKRRTVESRIFPGYILIQMMMTDDSWYMVRNTPGVTGFVGSGNRPTPLHQEEVDKIMKRMEAETPKVRVSFRVGETVRIIDGPFTDFMGTVDEINTDKGRVKVLLSFFGRETPVELDFLQVEKG
jgi:transcriptional antiterminator NusG